MCCRPSNGLDQVDSPRTTLSHSITLRERALALLSSRPTHWRTESAGPSDHLWLVGPWVAATTSVKPAQKEDRATQSETEQETHP